MATVSYRLSSTASVSCDYTVTDYPDRVRFVINSTSFKNTSSGGVQGTYELYCTLRFGGDAAGYEEGTARITSNVLYIPTGTTTKRQEDNNSVVLQKTHSVNRKVLDCRFHMRQYTPAGTVEYLDDSTTISSSYTVPAKSSYAVTYNANGGTGAPSAQTKWYGEALTLSSTRPTRPDFAFTNYWNTSSAGSGTNYASGASYTANAAATLYAQWRRTYADPKASVRSVQRVDATTHDPDEYGTSVAVTLTWSLFDTPSGTNHPTSVAVACNGVTETLISLTGLTGTATAYLDASCLPDQQYPVTVTLTDEGGASRSATAEGVVTTPYYPIDIRQGGKGVAIGGPSSEDAFDVYMPVKVLKRSTSASDTPFQIHDGVVAVADFPWSGGLRLRKNGYLNLYDENEVSDPGTPPETAHYGQSLMGYDANGYNNFYSQTAHTSADSLYRSFVARRKVSGSDVTNGFYLYIDANGTLRVTFSAPAAWCAGLDSGRYTAPTALTLNSACVAYNSAQTPKYSKDGHVVNVCGAVSPASEVAAGGTVSIGTLPAGFRPAVDLNVLCQGSSNAVWLLTINTSGGMSASRYRNGTTNAAITTSTWLPFSVTFMTTTL